MNDFERNFQHKVTEYWHLYKEFLSMNFCQNLLFSSLNSHFRRLRRNLGPDWNSISPRLGSCVMRVGVAWAGVKLGQIRYLIWKMDLLGSRKHKS